MDSKQATLITRISVATVGALVLAGFISSEPAWAEEVETPSEADSEQAIGSIVPEVLEDVSDTVAVTDTVVTETFDGEGVEAASVELNSETGSVSIETGSSGLVTLAPIGEDGSIADAAITDSGALYSTHVEGVSSTSLIKDGGSIQIISTIGDKSASTRIPYLFASTSLMSIESVDGSLLLRDGQGELLAGVAPAWAKDSNGVDVPTHYEVDGFSITQVVDHQAGNYAYPIVADPFWGTNLFDSVKLGNNVHILKPSGWGRAIQNGAVGTATIGQTILLNDGWQEFKDRSPGPQWIYPTVMQQYACHVRFARIDWVGGPTWDLEITRPVVVPDGVKYEVLKHQCNWNYSDGRR